MSVQKIIQEALSQNPLGLKEAVAEELRARVALALEEKIKESKYNEELDEFFIPSPIVRKAAKLAYKGVKNTLVNKKGNFRFSTAGKADSAEARANALEKQRKDRERLQKARERQTRNV